jgi:hypothetical protein
MFSTCFIYSQVLVQEFPKSDSSLKRKYKVPYERFFKFRIKTRESYAQEIEKKCLIFEAVT